MASLTRRSWVRAASASLAWVALVASLASVALAGCGHRGNPGATSATTTTASSTWSRPAAPPDPRTLESAGAAAVAKVPNGTLIAIRTEQGGAWKVGVVSPDGTQQSMDVSSDGVTVMVGPTPINDSDADKAERSAWVKAATLDYRAAVNKMLAAVPSGSITKLDLGASNGTTVWEADVWDTYLVEHIVTINAASGELIANKQV